MAESSLLDSLIMRDSDVKAEDAALSLLNTSASWQPDTLFNCQVCERKFTLTSRRHHCRTCGKLICDSCSELIKVPVGWITGNVHMNWRSRVKSATLGSTATVVTGTFAKISKWARTLTATDDEQDTPHRVEEDEDDEDEFCILEEDCAKGLSAADLQCMQMEEHLVCSDVNSIENMQYTNNKSNAPQTCNRLLLERLHNSVGTTGGATTDELDHHAQAQQVWVIPFLIYINRSVLPLFSYVFICFLHVFTFAPAGMPHKASRRAPLRSH